MSHIDDVVQALTLFAEKKGVEGQIFNINTPDIVIINELVSFITDMAGVKRPMHVPIAAAWVLASLAMVVAKIIRKQPFLNYEIVRVATLKGGARDIRKAREMLNFQPKYQEILEGIGESYFQKVKEAANN
jgi:nucleoside-diphosphate-sugar epimerase